MSFSGEVKEELFRRIGKGRHCQLAELAAMLAFDGRIGQDASVELESENPLLLEKYHRIEENLFPGGAENPRRILEAVKMWDGEKKCPDITDVVNGLLLQQSCCKRAFIRGAFLAAGSISDPKKSYHFEIVCKSLGQAKQLQENINSFEMDAKIVARKKYQVVYLKEGAQIVDMLGIMEAHVALMDLENVRILKEMRNSVNRQVNCETANISKTVNAAVKQIEDIEYIRQTAGIDSLPENLRETALIRLEYPEAALGELGAYLNPPIGKSGVNHRLRKISDMAEALRNRRKEM